MHHTFEKNQVKKQGGVVSKAAVLPLALIPVKEKQSLESVIRHGILDSL